MLPCIYVIGFVLTVSKLFSEDSTSRTIRGLGYEEETKEDAGYLVCLVYLLLLLIGIPV